MKAALYIARTIVISTLIVLLVFIGLILFINLLGEIQSIGTGAYGFLQGLSYVILTLPQTIYGIFPTIILIGVLIGLGTLASHNELTIMRTSGMSLARIATIVTLSAIVVTLVMTLIGEGIAPNLAKIAQDNKNIERNNGQIVSTVYGLWIRNNDVFYHIIKIASADQVFGVLRFEFNDEHHLISASHAVSGKLTNKKWIFSNVKVSEVFADHVVQKKYASISWPLTFNIHQFANSDPSFLSLTQLHSQIHYGMLAGSNVSANQINFWSRIFQPLMTLIMILVAIPFIFGPLRSVSIGLRLLSGITVGLVFYILNKFLVSFSLAYQIQPMIAAMLLPLLFLLFAVFLFWWKR